MDRLTAERFGSAGTLHLELASRPRPVAVPDVAGSWRHPIRTTVTDQTWEEYRDAYARAEARLAEAARNGHDDSWWEDDHDA